MHGDDVCRSNSNTFVNRTASADIIGWNPRRKAPNLESEALSTGSSKPQLQGVEDLKWFPDCGRNAAGWLQHPREGLHCHVDHSSLHIQGTWRRWEEPGLSGKSELPRFGHADARRQTWRYDDPSGSLALEELQTTGYP